MTLFEKIIQGDIPANIVFSDDVCIAFHDINPQAPVHVLIVPKRVIIRLSQSQDSDENILGHLLAVAKTIAEILKVADSGYRVVINSGRDAGESVPHLHLHLLGGRQLTWPPG